MEIRLTPMVLLTLALWVDAALVQPPLVLRTAPRCAVPVAALAENEAKAVIEATAKLDECVADAQTMEELEACVEEAETIFTMQPRDDGWDDVRDAIVKFKKERGPALDQLKSNFVRDTAPLKPVAKWTKVLAEELVETVSGDSPPAQLPSLGKVELPSIPSIPLPLAAPEESLSPEEARRRQVSAAVKSFAALIPEPKEPKAVKEAARPPPKQTAPVTETGAVSPLILLSYLAFPAIVAFYLYGGSVDATALLDAAPDVIN